MVSRMIQVINPSGLHLRPAGILCQTTMKFKSKIAILHNDKVFNAKSVINMMTSGIKCGAEIEIRCMGEDEAEALEATCHTILNGLEEY